MTQVHPGKPMAHLFLIADVNPGAAASRFEALRATLLSLLAPSIAPATNFDIQHIGSTAVPGCLTKGDIDLCVRVPLVLFAQCETALAAALTRNEGSLHTPTLASFIFAPNTANEAGIQLVAAGSEHDTFVLFRDLLLANPALVQDYNALKQSWHNKPMDAYREAKSHFVEAAIKNHIK